MKMKYKFKPLDNLHLNFIWIFYICPIIPLDIGCLIVCFNKFNIQYFITCLIFTLLPIIVFIIVRIFYPYKYVIEHEYITKFKGKKILFKIKRENLKSIIVKKAKPISYFKFIISLVAYKLSTANVTSISFIFNKYDVLTNYNYGEFKRLSLKDDLFSNDMEYVEIMSYRRTKKLAKILNVNLNEI